MASTGTFASTIVCVCLTTQKPGSLRVLVICAPLFSSTYLFSHVVVYWDWHVYHCYSLLSITRDHYVYLTGQYQLKS